MKELIFAGAYPQPVGQSQPRGGTKRTSHSDSTAQSRKIDEDESDRGADACSGEGRGYSSTDDSISTDSSGSMGCNSGSSSIKNTRSILSSRHAESGNATDSRGSGDVRVALIFGVSCHIF